MEDFKDRYVLGGRCHDPEVSVSTSEGCFEIIFSGQINDDASAIVRTDQIIEEMFMLAKAGECLSATLKFNDRIVKNYPERTK